MPLGMGPGSPAMQQQIPMPPPAPMPMMPSTTAGLMSQVANQAGPLPSTPPWQGGDLSSMLNALKGFNMTVQTPSFGMNVGQDQNYMQQQMFEKILQQMNTGPQGAPRAKTIQINEDTETVIGEDRLNRALQQGPGGPGGIGGPMGMYDRMGAFPPRPPTPPLPTVGGAALPPGLMRNIPTMGMPGMGTI